MVTKGKPKLTIELEVEVWQELASTCRATAKKIDWVLDNRRPIKQGEIERLDLRAQVLIKTATHIETALHERARANEKGNNVVKIASKK